MEREVVLMSAKKTRPKSWSTLDLIEEATHTMRLMPARLLTLYYAGTLPFVLAFLYFWTDMSKSAIAYQHVAGSAFTLALLFVWMKSWQAVFMRELRAFIGHESAGRWSAMKLGRLVLTQGAIQPTGLVAIPLALLMLLPFGWVFALYQNVLVFGDGSIEGFRKVTGRAWEQAKLFPKQNHLVLLLLSLFWLFVFLNIVVVVVYAPYLLKMLFGVETLFTKAGGSVLNTTLLIVALGASFLVVDPLFKTAYALRCFYGESLQSGEDLMLDLRRIVERGKVAAVVLGIVFMSTVCAYAAEEFGKLDTNVEVEAEEQSVSAEELDAAIDEVISQREYEWRLPRVDESEVTGKRGLIETFLSGVADTVAGWLKPVKDWIKDVGRWIEEKLSKLRWPEGEKARSGHTGSLAPDILMYVLLAAVACTLGVFAYRLWLRGRTETEIPEVAEKVGVPDVSDEDVTADELPSDSWLQLARKLMEKGKVRLALRAFFLASLAHLAQQELITIAKFKSNHDYQYELNMKARSMPDLLEAFSQNVRIFEDVWYGMHKVEDDALKTFRNNLRKVTRFA